MNRKITIFIILFVFLTANVFAQNFDELEKTVRAELQEKNAVGAGVAIIKDDKVVFAKGFGTANVETNQPITPDTLFQIGSITKTFTAAMILSLVEDGKLKLDQPIGVYAKNLSPKLSRVTLHQLLSHTGGILDEPDEYGAADESLMASYIRSWTDDYCLFGGGEVFSYSNSGFALAGFTAQEASGKPYVDLMTERIFAPLKMKSTTFRPTVAMTHPLAVGLLALKAAEVVKPKPAQTLTEAEMSKYVGTYWQPNRFKIDIFTRDGKLFIKEFNQELALSKIGENRFSFQFPQAKQPVEIYVKPAADGKSGFVHQYVWAFKKN